LISLSLSPSDFENLRLALLSTYNQQTLAHAGYVISIGVALATLFWTYFAKEDDIRNFHNKELWQKVTLYLASGFLVVLFFYCLYRLVFWAWMSSAVLGVTQEQITGNSTVILGIQTHLSNYFGNTTSSFSVVSTVPSTFYYLDQNFGIPWTFLLFYPIAILLCVGLVKMLTNKGFPIPIDIKLTQILIVGIITNILMMLLYWFTIGFAVAFSSIQKIVLLSFFSADSFIVSIIILEITKVFKARGMNLNIKKRIFKAFFLIKNFF
jgi:hypothetical protein